MKIPKKPKKPIEPTRPVEVNTFKYTPSIVSIDTGDNLKSIIENLKLTLPEGMELDLSKAKLDISYDDDYGNSSSVQCDVVLTRTGSNLNFDKQLRIYIAKLADYKDKKIKYDKKLIEYDIQLTEYNKWLRIREIEIAKETFKKYGIPCNIANIN